MSSPAIHCLFLLLLITISSVAADETLTVYQALESYGFPIGLLPVGVTGYELDPSSGKFKAYLDGTCSFKVEDYELKYKSTISGVITKNRIRNLKGISVKVLILWLNISEVIRDDDELEFSVGIASANFAVDNFEECPQCGCGFDCVNGERKGVKLSLNRFVSSLVE
ncbi:hypothetical protein ACSBR2_031750 [Camellia fascicularis]